MTCLETLFLLYFWHLNNFCSFLYFLLLLRGNEVLLYGKLNVYDWYLQLFMWNTSFKNKHLFPVMSLWHAYPLYLMGAVLTHGVLWINSKHSKVFFFEGCWNVQRKFSEMKCRLLLFHWPAKSKSESWKMTTHCRYQVLIEGNSSADLL